MDLCAACKQPIKESVVQGRKLIAQVNTGPNAGSGRFLTVFNHTCACGSRVERRYENRTLTMTGY